MLDGNRPAYDDGRPQESCENRPGPYGKRPIPKPIKLLVTIVDRNESKKILSLLYKHGVHVNMAALARGTAKTELLDLLGLGETEKVVIFSIIKAEGAGTLLNTLNAEQNFSTPGNGILFTIPITSVGNSAVLSHLTRELLEEMHARRAKEANDGHSI